MAKQNPRWSRDELIVTLDFYLEHSPQIPDKGSQEIFELSKFLNILKNNLGGEGGESFRNPNGVYMKLMNFRRLDPSYLGKGLERGGKEDEIVWNLYSGDRSRLRELARGIRSFIKLDQPNSLPLLVDDGEESEEGRILTRTHHSRERDPKLVARKKQRALQEFGTLACEVCGFDFSEVYGERGDGYMECHHTKPVSELLAGEATRVRDLALVCANCHKMIHRRRPWIGVDELRTLLKR